MRTHLDRQRIVALSKATPKRLRLAVEGGGCSGFQ
jgi:Fe-S cluster assembly iron-binding protein IscA